MKLSKYAMLAAIACGLNTAVAEDYGNGIAQAGSSNSVPGVVMPVGCCEVPECGCEAPACGCEAPSCDSCCDSGCDSMLCGSGCCLTEKLNALNLGGWIQLGYHTGGNRYNGPGGPVTSNFNDYPDKVRLQQAYLYLEEVADGSNGLGFGGRVDYVYGIDGPDTQAFGQDNGWDTGWDNGAFYGSALPQAYAEVAYGNTSIKMGHFYTTVGYEVVPATGNFFYSHSMTMYNAEPFTHTGIIITEKLSDEVSMHGGYVTGWDSGFDDNGDCFLGGLSLIMSDDVTFNGQLIAGRFNEANSVRPLSERGYETSFNIVAKLSDKLTYVFWNDHLKESTDATGLIIRDVLDITQFLIYDIDEKVSLGGRFEWMGFEGAYFPRVGAPGGVRVPGDRSDLYIATIGLNVKPTSNVIIRPECRWNLDVDQTGINDRDSNSNFQSSEAVFGVDAILTF